MTHISIFKYDTKNNMLTHISLYLFINFVIINIFLIFSLSTLLAAVQAAGLAETFTQPGPFTVFAPSNDAFAKVSFIVQTTFA